MSAPLTNWWLDAPDVPQARPEPPAPIVWMREAPTYRHPDQPAEEHSPAFRAVVTVFAFVATLAIVPGIAAWLAGGMS